MSKNKKQDKQITVEQMIDEIVEVKVTPKKQWQWVTNYLIPSLGELSPKTVIREFK